MHQERLENLSGALAALVLFDFRALFESVRKQTKARKSRKQ
jgi:hypothetical protein